jgi:hypothetical protein
VRYFVTATMAASVLAIGLTMEPALSLPLGGKASTPDTAIQKVQQQGKGMGGGNRGPAAAGGANGGGMRSEGGQAGTMRGRSAAQLRSGEKGMGGGHGAQLGSHPRGGYGYGPEKLHRGGFHFTGRRGGVATCASLRRRAHDTGSPYWLHRYQACRGGLGG